MSADNPLTTAWLVKNAILLKREFFFDPGQVLPVFIEGITNHILKLDDILTYAKGIFVNDYESELLLNHIKKPLNQMLTGDQFVVRTLDAKGVELITYKETLAIPVVEAETILDPTGCGDAFRAGFLHQYIRGKNFKECLELGATMGSFAIEQAGGQNHKIEINTIFERMKESFKKNSYKM